MKNKIKWLPLFYLIPYGVCQWFFLVSFPLVHSDESWLGGLSRNMLATGSLACTEPFFNAKPRFPHAIKSLFHLLQQAAIELGGYTPLTLRALSLLAGCVCLAVFYLCALRLLRKTLPAFCAMLLLSVDIQFLYASHFARSEIFILLFLCACLYFLLAETVSMRTALGCALICGTAVFFHPNSFLLACACGLTLLYRYRTARTGLRPLWVYCGVTGGIAAAAVCASFAMDSDFIRHYLAYGNSEFDLLVSPGGKLADLFGFFARLLERQSGTYYLPDIRPQLVVFSLCALLCLAFAWVMRHEQAHDAQSIFTLLCAETGLLAGIALIGRLNQTYVILLFPVGVLLTAFAANLLLERFAPVLLACACAASLTLSAAQIIPIVRQPSYAQYIEQLAAVVPPDAKTIANLNTGFYFANDALLDYRNLPYAALSGGIAAYVRENKVEYILYSDELDFIDANRPFYNVIYGNAAFVGELRAFCESECKAVGEFYNGVYGTRINALADDPAYGNVTVYQVKKMLYN